MQESWAFRFGVQWAAVVGIGPLGWAVALAAHVVAYSSAVVVVGFGMCGTLEMS